MFIVSGCCCSKWSSLLRPHLFSTLPNLSACQNGGRSCIFGRGPASTPWKSPSSTNKRSKTSQLLHFTFQASHSIDDKNKAFKKLSTVEDEEHNKIAKKLTIGLWSIQWYPVDRPSMKSVVQMLEGEAENLTVPPNRFASKDEMKAKMLINRELATISE